MRLPVVSAGALCKYKDQTGISSASQDAEERAAWK